MIDVSNVTCSKEFQSVILSANKTTPNVELIEKKIELLVCLYTLRALYQLGWEPRNLEEISVHAFCEKYKIIELYHRQVQFYFNMLEEVLGMLIQVSNNRSNQTTWLVQNIQYRAEEDVMAKASLLYSELIVEESVTNIVKFNQNLANFLADILTGEISPLHILFPVKGDQQEYSLENYYLNQPSRNDLSSKTHAAWSKLWKSIYDINVGRDSNRMIRVLEVGAGTGSASLVALSQLKQTFGTKFEYYYTDISPAFFAKSEKRLEDFKGNLRFCTFNIEESPLDQGIPTNYFDCVIGTDVLHATRNLKETLRNLRITLRPKGILSFTETLTQNKRLTFTFGLLDGYWRFNDYETRPHHACVNANTWKRLLLESGFTYMHCCEAYFGVMGCIIAEASSLPGYEVGNIIQHGEISASESKKRWIIFSSNEEAELMLKAARSLEAGGCKVDVVFPMPEMETEEARICSILGGCGGNKNGTESDIDGIIYGWAYANGLQEQKQMSRPFFHIAKYILNERKPPRLYIFVRDVFHVVTEDVKNPWSATIPGMVKSWKNEYPDLFIRCVDLESNSEHGALMNQILFELAMYNEAREKDRILVAYRQGSRYEPRLSQVPAQQLSQTQNDLQLPLGTNRYRLQLPPTRMISDLKFIELEDGKVEESQVEVRIRAYALNFRDIFAILKPVKEFEDMNIVASDFAGVVTKTGKCINPEKFKVGDLVIGVNFSDIQLPSHVICKSGDLKKMSDRMTFSEACTIPTVFATVVCCLKNVADLRENETVLIHTGSGGVGLAAIQLAKLIGAKIITTAGSLRKRTYLRGLGIEHVFHSRSTSFKDDILKVTNGRGVDVVLNSLTGNNFKEASLEVCAKNARFVEMSKLNIWTKDEVMILRSDVQYFVVDVGTLGGDAMLKLVDTLKAGSYYPIPFVQFDAQRIRHALQFLQRAKHIGKVVVTMPEVTTFHGQWKLRVLLFNERSTYLITGGLGGIGFEVCKWMLEKGATDIVLIGRNPPKEEVAAEIKRLNKLSRNNIMVKLADVGDYEQCKILIGELNGKGYKPIRGVHHCAGVLRDNIFQNQTWEGFAFTFGPKVNGSWNIHRLLKGINLEHFVLYSSFTSLVGTPSQANHVAANCFEDALAQFRYSLGLPATTINWGQWAQVGCAKEINIPAVLPVSVTRMLNGLEETLRSQRLQTAYMEFESLNSFTTICPTFKYYLDEKLLKNLNDSAGKRVVVLQSAQFWQEVDEAPTAQLKIDVVMRYMKDILRINLRMQTEESIQEDDDIQDLGVDSLMLIEFRNSIQSLLAGKIPITANMLKDRNTIRELATVVVNNIVDAEDQDLTNIPNLTEDELHQLLIQDCRLDETIKPEKSYVSGSLNCVLVTGVTGQLGPYVLSQLCKIPRLETIVCLIRTKGSVSPEKRLVQVLEFMDLTEKVDMSRVKCFSGDLTLPYFGLSQDIYNQLCGSIDGIIHLAVKSNHVEPYRKLEGNSTDVRTVNVGGTLAVLNFAVAQKTKCVYHASSILSMFGKVKEGPLSDDWLTLEDVAIIARNAMVAYPASKFVCEMLMKQANERGIPCKVFRFPFITGDSKNGRVNFQNNHFILRFISYLKLKEMPSSPLPAIVLPVDICADWSLKLFCNDQAPCRIYNIVHPNPQLEVEFVSLAKAKFGTDIELVEWDLEKGNTDFLERLCATDMPMESLKEFYQVFDRIVKATTSGTFGFIQGYISSPDTYFHNEMLKKFIPDFSHNLPSTTDIIRMNLEYARNMGYFSRFGLSPE